MDIEQILEKLVEFNKNSFLVTSAYLTVANPTCERKTHIVKLKSMIRYKKNTTYFKQLSEEEQKSVLADFDRILNWYNEGFDSVKFRSSICFSSTGAGLWETINTKYNLEDELVVQPKPYIRPLHIFQSSHRSYAIILVDKAKARIIESRHGEYIEHLNTKDTVPDNVNVGGFQGTEERKVDRKMQQAVSKHYKAVAQKVFDLDQKHKFNWIIIGGRKEAIGEFEKYLHSHLISKIQGRIEVDPAAPINEVLKRIEETEEKAREEFEKKLTEKLEESIPANQGIVGPDAVIKAIENNIVQTLLIKDSFVKKGVFCRRCTYIGLKPKSECPICGEHLERTNDIVEQMLHIAHSQGVNVEFVNNLISDSWDIAAILRYPLVGAKLG